MTSIALLCAALVPRLAAATPATPEELFVIDKTWDVHLAFTPDQWAALEPQDDARRAGAFEGPAALPVAGLMGQGDSNGDAHLSKDELLALGRRWWATSNVPRAGRVDRNGARAALRAFLPEPGRPGDGGGPGAPPGPPRLRFEYARADLELDGHKLARVAVRHKGNNTFMASRGSLKRPLKLDLERGFAGRSLAGVTKLNLHNNVNDATSMNEALSYRLFREAGVPAPRTAYARVWLTVAGQQTGRLLGLYTLVENVDRDFLRQHFGATTGALFKPETRRLFEDLGADWAAYERAYLPKTPVDSESAARLMALSRLVSHGSDGELAARIGDYVDLDQFARFMAVTVWLSSMDSLLGMGHNFYVYLRPDTRRFQFIPWDLDHSFGQFSMAGSPGALARLDVARPWQGPNLLLERLWRVAAFRDLYVARLRAFNDTLARPERLAGQVDALASSLRSTIRDESLEKLARFDAAVGGERAPRPRAPEAARGRAPAGPPNGHLAFRPGIPAPPGLGGPRRAGDRPEPPGGGPWAPPPGFAERPVSPLKTFLRERSRSVAAQLSQERSDRPAARPTAERLESGPDGFDPPAAMASALLSAFDADRSGTVTEVEVLRGLERHFDAWDADRDGTLAVDELRSGLARDLLPFPPPPPAPEAVP